MYNILKFWPAKIVAQGDISKKENLKMLKIADHVQ